VKLEVLESFDAVGEATWQRLHAASAFRAPFTSWAWQTTWFGAFGEGRRLQLLRLDDGVGDPAGVLPLYEESPGVLALVGGVDVSDYLDVVCPAGTEGDVWTALLESRATSPVVWDLHAIRAASPTVDALRTLAPAHGLRVEQEVEERCPVLDLPATWEAYLAKLTGKHRHELTRKIRRFEREVPGARVTSVASEDDVAARMGDFLTLHRASRVGKSRFMDERMERFFRTSLGALARAGQVRLWFLERDTGAVATFICLEWPGCVGLYNSGFDPALASVAPGIVLLAHVIRDALDRRLPRFDFLRGEERYKYEFEPRPEDLLRLRVTP
jgi:CelD/BcsL family acetyltransferase involved in cellulose biosynthesis